MGITGADLMDLYEGIWGLEYERHRLFPPYAGARTTPDGVIHAVWCRTTHMPGQVDTLIQIADDNVLDVLGLVWFVVPDGPPPADDHWHQDHPPT